MGKDVLIIEYDYNGIAKVLSEFRLLYESGRIDKSILNKAFENFTNRPTYIISKEN